MTLRLRLALVDDHHLVLKGLRALLQDTHDIVGTATSAREARTMVSETRPDLLLLDLGLPDQSGLELIADLRADHPDLPILVVTMHADRVLADAALSSGAAGFITKDAELEDLQDAIAAVAAGRRYLSPLVKRQSRRVAYGATSPGLDQLTPRQQAIVRLLATGKSTGEIAEALHLSPATVTFHRSRIRQILSFESEWELIRYAILVGISETDSDAAADEVDG